jgi:mono/diheme cytochrome c family protein
MNSHVHQLALLKSTRFHALAVVVAAASIGVAGAGCRGWESESPPVHLNWNMDTQEKGKAFRHSDFFADGRYMRTPPTGTVARGFLREDEGRSFGRVDGDPTTTFPVLADAELAVQRGQQKYGIYCAPCHGLAGDGDGVVNTHLTVKAPSFHDTRLKEMPVGKMYEAILLGVNGGNMGSYAAQIQEDDRWNTLAYVRAMQKNKDPSVTLGGKPEVKVSDDATPEQKGQALYASKGCNACHSLDGAAGVGPTWAGLYGKKRPYTGGETTADDAYLVESIRLPQAKIVTGYGPVMPAYGDALLTDDEVQHLIAFIKTIKN